MKIEQSARHHQNQYAESQRKLLDIHYTPDNLIDYIIRHTVLSYLEKNNFATLPQIKILDPAYGSGLFLLKAFDLLCSLWQLIKKNNKSLNKIMNKSFIGSLV
jgi:predicted helicase